MRRYGFIDVPTSKLASDPSSHRFVGSTEVGNPYRVDARPIAQLRGIPRSSVAFLVLLSLVFHVAGACGLSLWAEILCERQPRAISVHRHELDDERAQREELQRRIDE